MKTTHEFLMDAIEKEATRRGDTIDVMYDESDAADVEAWTWFEGVIKEYVEIDRQNRWIDARATPPPTAGYYIAACVSPYKEPGLIHFHPNAGWQNGFYEVSHWMPLPKLPEPEIIQ